ncbi:hypothetical protein EHS25_006391 [Saitozyma podzolica]|uniref:Uncharacterized protein n=1 Tax=Saitozyma podzolica TaxID=1890683 RepID=A0A427YRJ2_9TREE|nr:hypothetical protein EHS25_006391 [Saitozyma podzolica]
MFTTLVGVTVVAASVAFAETVTSFNGDTFSCPTTEQSVQAYAPLCPTTLQDGTAMVGKDLQLGYPDAPTSYQSTLVNRIALYCTYTTGTCLYIGGLGVSPIALAAGTSSGGHCYPTTIDNGVNPQPPQPSGGAYYKKRDAASDIASYIAPYVCPLVSTSGAPFVGLQELVYYDYPLQLSLTCTYYTDLGRSTYYDCIYDTSTGDYTGTDADDGSGCPTSACTAPPMDGTGPLRKRHNSPIDKRQVDTAALRRRDAGGSRVHARLSPSAVFRRNVD